MATKQNMKLKSGQVLISEPFLTDPNFNRTVILIAEQNEFGTTGFVLNQRTDYAVNMLLDELAQVSDSVFQGGPVELETFNYIHCYNGIENSIEVKAGLYWGGDFTEICNGISSKKYNQNNFKFFLGYSGWAVGQLEMELEEGAWIVGDLETDTILDQKIEDDLIWKLAIRGVGGDTALLANSPKFPDLN